MRLTKNVPGWFILHYSSTLVDHILTNTQEDISQSGVIDTAISDHSLIYCTRKIPKAKYNRHEITFRSRNYSTDVYKGTLKRVSFLIMKTFIILKLHIVILLLGLTV